MASESNDGVTIQAFATRDAAQAAAALLEANGIACRIIADDCGGLLPNLSLAEGVRLVVSASDLTAACELLELPPPSESAAPTQAPENSPRSMFAFGYIIIGAVIGVVIVVSAGGLSNQKSAPLQRSTPVRQTHDDYSPDGKRSDRWVYRQGHLVEHLEDRNLDGSWDHWAYYENGEEVRSEYDNNFDGNPDETWIFKDGHVVSMEKDLDFNGVPDEFCTYKYNIVQQADIRPNGSKFSTVRELFSNGVLTEIRRGGDSNGVFREIVKYDAFCNPISTNVTSYPLLPVR